MDITDDLPPGEAFRTVSSLFAKGDSFCIRLSSPESQAAKSDRKATLEEVEKLPDIVQSGIAADHPELMDLWKELRDAATPKAE